MRQEEVVFLVEGQRPPEEKDVRLRLVVHVVNPALKQITDCSANG